jgi:cytochrome bd-type quinol oxidase subunit 2
MVLLSLLLSIYKAYTGYTTNKSFSKTDNALRHWTATIAHVQLMLGVILYIKSPIVQYFWKDTREAVQYTEPTFFALYHFILMSVAVVLITIGSALAKRRVTDQQKFKTILVWFSITLLIILIAIPWKFLPRISRPYIRILNV